MTERTAPTDPNTPGTIARPVPGLDPGFGADARVPQSWTRVRLIEPTTAGFLYLGASSGPWRAPVPLPRGRRRRILTRMHEAAAALGRDPRVVRVDVFEGLLRPPGRSSGRAGRRAPDADFDAVLLVETETVADAAALQTSQYVTGLLADLQAADARPLAFAGSNVRRIGPVDHDSPGVFLFNYFSAPDAATNLHAWQYTAGWFQDETGLDNSTVLQPVQAQTDPQASPYTLVNHCRWDRLRNIVPDLIVKASFRDFVLRVFADHDVAPRPILYRLHRPPARNRASGEP